MADLNIVEKANKIISFRKVIRDICRKKGLEYPSDAKIAEYIADCGGDECVYDINDFMCDYENKIGVFRDPFTDFKAEVMNELADITEKPTDEEMREYICAKGYDVEGFLSQVRRKRIIDRLSPLEKSVLNSVLNKCSVPQLVSLWNIWIEEAAVYGEDSYIYDFTNKEDLAFLREHMNFTQDMKAKELKQKGVRYISWHNLNDGAIIGFTNNKIMDIIVAYWTDIFPRFLVWGECYKNLGTQGRSDYFEGFFDIVIRPTLLEALGYNYNPVNGALTKTER